MYGNYKCITVVENLQLPTLSHISITMRDINKYIYNSISNIIVNMNKYFFFLNIQLYYCYLIKCNILVLIFKYLNNIFF